MNLPSNVTWYKDAIIYEVHVRAFYDSVTDGIGDFGGLTQKLDYLEDLGVTAVWLLPFCPSPLRDDGYDISNYTDVHPAYGTLRDFQRFLREAHRRGLRVITELVLNHTSDQHVWFQRSRRAAPGSRWRNFYVWSDTPEKYRDARIIFKDFESSNWTWDPVAKAYYWHRFYSHQPDLNWDNPEVKRGACSPPWTSGSTWAWTAFAWMPCPTSSSAKAPTARTCPKPTRRCASCASTWTRISRPHAAGRGQSVAGRRGRLLWQRRRMPHGIPLPGDAAAVHVAAHGRPLSRSPTS